MDTGIVDDEYWLRYANKVIDNSITAKNEAAAKLEKMIIWFWALYTTSFTIGITINEIEASTWVLVLLASPIIVLLITYWLCTWVQLPVTTNFDPRIPYEIIQAYNLGHTDKDRRFKRALFSSFFSALILAAALFSLSFVKKKDKESLTSVYNKETGKIIISGNLPKNVLAFTTIDTLDSKSARVSIHSNTYQVQENGVFNLNYTLNKHPKNILVTVTWNEEKETKGFAQLLKR